jgi:hypothetical protein
MKRKILLKRRIKGWKLSDWMKSEVVCLRLNFCDRRIDCITGRGRWEVRSHTVCLTLFLPFSWKFESTCFFIFLHIIICMLYFIYVTKEVKDYLKGQNSEDKIVKSHCLSLTYCLSVLYTFFLLSNQSPFLWFKSTWLLPAPNINIHRLLFS